MKGDIHNTNNTLNHLLALNFIYVNNIFKEYKYIHIRILDNNTVTEH